MNWLDGLIIIILVFGAINGLRRGLISSIIKLFGLIISIYIAKTYYLAATVFIMKNTHIQEKIASILSKSETSALFQIPISALTLFSKNGGLANDAHSFITASVLNAISLFALFIACRIIFLFIDIFLNIIFKAPGLNDVNKLGGLFIGFAGSILGLLVFFAVIIPLTNISSWQFMSDAISASTLSKYFYSYNFVLNWILDSALNLINIGFK